jgi:HEAT repeat protein
MIDFGRKPLRGQVHGFLDRMRAALHDGLRVGDSYRALADALHAEPAVAEQTLTELCLWSDDDLMTFLDGAWTSEVPEALDVAAAVVQRRGLTGLLPWVDRLLQDETSTRWLVDVLSEVRDDDSTRLLIRLMDHGSSSIRRRAADGLAAHRSHVDGRALVRFLASPLVQTLSYPDPLAAVRALHRLAEPSLEPDFGHDTARRAERVLVNCVVHDRRTPVRGDAIAALGDLGSRAAVRCLVDMLHRDSETFHRDVVIALRKIRPDRALIALLGLLRSRDPIIREEAAHALGEIGDQQAVRRVRALLDDENSDVRQEAVLALGKLGGREVLDALDRALADDDPHVRINACSALAEGIGRSAQGKLIRALYDGSPDVRAEAAHLLGDIGDEEAQRHLELLLTDGARDAFGDRVGSIVRKALARLERSRRYGPAA